jgi:tetratricopeptide (TPR) repeat protein
LTPRFLKILLLLLLSLQAFSQKYIHLKTYNVDSLLAILPEQTGKERVNSLNGLAVSLSFIDYGQSTQFAGQAIDLARELEYVQGIADAFRNYGQIYVYQGNYLQALDNYLKALTMFEELKDKHTAGWVCYEIAKVNYFASNYETAIRYCQKALDLAEKSGQSNIELMLLSFVVGTNFWQLGEIDSAKAYLFKALAYPDESRNMKILKYRNLDHLGWIHYESGNTDSAVYYFKKAFEFYYEEGFLYWAMVNSRDLGYVHYSSGDLDSASIYLDYAGAIFAEMLIKNSWYRYDSLKYIANYGLELYFPLPPVRLRELSWAEGVLMYRLLYQLHSAQNKTREALYDHIAYSDARDTLNKLQRNREMIEIQTRYESERKDQQIRTLSLENDLKETRLQQSRYFLFGSAGFSLIVLILGFILYRQNKLKTEQKVLVLQQKLFRSQMNPHFIFNSLTSIQNFIVREDTRKANVYLSRFSELVRSILDNSSQEYILLEKEISAIRNYLELQQVRYRDTFDYTIDVDEAIDAENLMIPPMLAQPFIENSIEHGIRHKTTLGHINVRFKQVDHMIYIEVEDDGVGREKAREVEIQQQKDHRSMATSITRERLETLNKKLKYKISLTITDLHNALGEATGTKVVFEIPIALQ